MEGLRKLLLFLSTLGMTLITVSAFITIWTETATLNNAYTLGFVLGFVDCLFWIFLIRYWNKS